MRQYLWAVLAMAALVTSACLAPKESSRPGPRSVSADGIPALERAAPAAEPSFLPARQDRLSGPSGEDRFARAGARIASEPRRA